MDLEQREDDIPRVSIDTLQAWAHIKENYSAALMQKLRDRLPPGNAEQKERLESYMNQFIERSFEIARPNIRVNGRNLEDVDESEQDMEPFDEAFDSHIWALGASRLDWDLKNGTSRREKPVEVGKAIQAVFTRWRSVEDVSGDIENDEEMLDAQVSSVPPEDLHRVWLSTCALSDKLQEMIPRQTERSERVGVVETEVKGLKL